MSNLCCCLKRIFKLGYGRKKVVSGLHLTISFIFLCTLSQAQNLNFQKYGVGEGLSSNTVFSTIEDKDGFIWISTEEGVDRFDGLNFRHYNLPSLYEYRTVNDVEYYLKIDSNNEIWLLTLGGLLYHYNPSKDEFVLFLMLKDQSDQAFLTFHIDHNNHLWFGMEDGVLVLDPDSVLFHRIPIVKHTTSSIIQDDKLRYYLGTNNGVVVLDSNQNFLYNLLDVSSSEEIGLKDSEISSLFVDEENDRLWIGSRKLGLCVFNLVNFDFIRPKGLQSFKGLKISSFERFSKEEVIIGVDGEGLLIWNLNQQKVIQKISDQDIGPSALSSRSVQQVFRNSTGVFFVSTWRGGLNVYSPSNLNFSSIKHFPNTKKSLRNDVVMMLFEISPDVIGFGTDKGISVWDKKEDNWQHLEIEHSGAEHMSNSRSIAVDQRNNLWATSYTDSLVLFQSTKGGDYTSTKNFPLDLSLNRFNKVFASSNDLIWFSDDDKKRITCYSLITQKVRHYPFAFGNVQTMLDLSTEQLALGTSSGLVVFNTDKGIAEELDIINTTRLKTTMISSMVLDMNKQLWVGTRYEGLFIINFFKNTVVRLTSENGLLSNRIFALTVDKGNVWASTSKGISRVDGKNNISNFTESDGLISVDFNYNAAFKDTDGQLYFGTNDGVITFNPDEIHPVTSDKSLAFNEFYLNHKRVLDGDNSPLDKSLNDTELIELRHNQNSFSIGFTSIDFLHSDQGNFQWKLENFDEEWISDQSTSRASYTNLNPGSYTFKLRMVGNKEDMMGKEKQVELIIHPPFWKTAWAYLIYFVIVILLLTLIIYSNGLRIKSEHSKEKLHYLVNIAHEIKTPLMLIKAPLTDLRNNNKMDASLQQGIDIALKNAEKVHQQMMQFLDFRHFGLRKKTQVLYPIDLVRFIQDKVFAFKILADKKNIDISLDSDTTHFMINADEKIFDKIIGNLLSNAIKYTLHNGKVSVKLATKKKCKISIKDSGIGIVHSQKRKIFQLFYRAPNAKKSGSLGTGVGLVLASDLAKLVGGKVFLEESSPKGSTFSFTFPYEHPIILGHSDKGTETVEGLQENEHQVTANPKVLLVDDNEDLLNFSKSKLSARFRVDTASNGYTALEVIKKNRPDIVVCDIVMPKMNGLQLCMSLKKNIETCHIPVILLTGLEAKENVLQGLESGADDYIVKPYDFELLFSKMEGLLQNRLVLKNKFLIHEEEKIEFSNELDDNFMKELTQFVEENISDVTFSIKDMCEAMGMSRTSFYHKLKSLIDISPNEFIRTIRLKKGRSMLLTNNYNVSEVAYNVGFSDAKYFGTLFKKYFGKSPSVFLSEKRNETIQVSDQDF